MDFTLVDVFNSALFTTTSLAAAVDRVPYVPGALGRMGLFEESGVNTTSIVIERRGSYLQLVPSKPRGAPGTTRVADKRDGVQLQIPHLPVRDTLTPDELQNVRGFGTPQMLVGVGEKRDEKITNLSRDLDVTLEYHRLGAISGIVLDADGGVLLNLFTEFEITPPTDIEFDFAAAWATEDGGVLKKQITGVVREIRDSLGGVSPTGYMALCGDAYFDDLTNHAEVRATYLNQAEANALRDDPIDTLRYGGVTFVNYRGWGEVAIPEDECRFIPRGVPGLFITRFAPAPHFSAVNTKGKPKYILPSLDKTGEKEIEIEAQSNPINVCTRPEALRTGKLA